MRPTVPIALAAIIGVSLGLFFALRDDASAPAAEQDESLVELQATLANSLVLPENFRQVPEFTLVGVDGEPIDQGFLEGQWTLAFFGFTHCPDVCPITLSVMQDVVSQLESRDVEPMQVAFFTVDPARDTAARMKEYVGFFDEDFVGVTGELNDVQELTSALGIVSAFTANDEEPENYVVDHTASMLLIDPVLRVRAKFNPPHETKPIIDDYLALRAALS